MLFDLSSDIGEKNNIIEKNRPLFNELVKKSVEWNKTLMDPIFLGLRDDELYNNSILTGIFINCSCNIHL